MNLTLDYNVELFPLEVDDVVALALSSSLSRESAPNTGAAGEENERDVWRPDGKGTRGLEDEYDYVMYGKVRFHCGSAFLGLQSPRSLDLQI